MSVIWIVSRVQGHHDMLHDDLISIVWTVMHILNHLLFGLGGSSINQLFDKVYYVEFVVQFSCSNS